MAAARGRTNHSLNHRLRAEPHRFDFFQAVRLLERFALEERRNHGGRGLQPVGLDEPPSREVVRFRAAQFTGFPAAAVQGIERDLEGRDGQAEGSARHQMQVTFLGLTGPSGVLPAHYTSLLLGRLREKDPSLREFLDLFNHRTISLFYRAWEKYRFPISYERSRLDPSQHHDRFTECLYALVGLGTGGLRGRLEVDDEAFLFYGGHFVRHPRCALSLERVVQEYFGEATTVQQFQGQWLYLDPEQQTSFPTRRNPSGTNARLGIDTIVGERVWDVQSRFRVRLGPLSYAGYCRFLPSGNGLRPLSELVRSYVGLEFDFDVQPVLQAREVPGCHLGSGAGASRLGWNTWLRTDQFTRDFEGAVFMLKDV